MSLPRVYSKSRAFPGIMETNDDREIHECSEFLNHMSHQWETARHCHMALTLLSTKIAQGEAHPDRLSHSHSYAMGTPREAPLSNTPGMGRKRKLRDSHGHETRDPEMQSPGSAPGTSSRSPPVEFGTTPRMSQYPIPGDTATGESSVEMDWVNPNQIHESSTFDLNMVDLLQGANFDSLFDMVGQQYPGF